MRRNQHQLEHVPTLLVQHICLEWSKDCRGGNAAQQRSQYPKAMQLPKDLLSYDYVGLPAHFVYILQSPDEFKVINNCHKLMEWRSNGTMRLAPFELIQQDHRILVQYRYDWHIGAMPERHIYDKCGQIQPLKELALDLSYGDFGQAVCNGRFSDVDTGQWYYKLNILNVMLLKESTDSLTCFTDRKPNKVYAKLDHLW